MSTKKIQLKELKVDPRLTELRPIQTTWVDKFRRALRAGEQFPSIVIEQGTNRIVSGNHRYAAMTEEFGKEHETTVEVKKYNNEAEVLADFAIENTKHGQALDFNTKCKLTHAMLKEGLTDEEIGGIFNLKTSQIKRMADNVVAVKIGNKIEKKPVKKGFEKPQKPLTKKQYEEHQSKDRGIYVTQIAGQLIRWLENGYIAHSEKNEQVLRHLKRLIEKFLEKEKVS